MPPPDVEPLQLPHRLAGTPYELRQLLGAGAMGAVYLAEHSELRRFEVVKVLHYKHSLRPEIIGRFRQEARLASQLAHPALPIIYGLGSTPEGQHWIAMERLDGEDLRGYLRKRGAIAWREAADLVAQALDGLAVAHAAGIIHRDLKPENLFRTNAGRIKLLDFGIAKPLEDQQATGVNTAFGMVLGTPRYMSPEQAKGNTLAPTTDLYAIGCVLFELIAGSPLVQGSDAKELLRQHIYGTPSTLAQRTGESFDPALEALLARAVAKEPSARFPSANEMASQLRALASKPDRITPPIAPGDAAHTEFALKATAHAAPAIPPQAYPTQPQLTAPTVPALTAVQTHPIATASLLGSVATTHVAANSNAPTATMTSAGDVAPAQTAVDPAPSVPKLPPGVIDYSLNSEALARELLATRTAAHPPRSLARNLMTVAGAITLLALAVVGAVSLLRANGSEHPTAAAKQKPASDDNNNATESSAVAPAASKEGKAPPAPIALESASASAADSTKPSSAPTGSESRPAVANINTAKPASPSVARTPPPIKSADPPATTPPVVPTIRKKPGAASGDRD